MDSRLGEAFGSIIGALGDHIRNIEFEAPAAPEDVWTAIVPLSGGQITSYEDEPRLHAEHDLNAFEAYPAFERSYGLDASTARTIAFHNGLVLDLANAVLGVKDGKKHLRNHQSLVAGVYHDDGLGVETYNIETVAEQEDPLPTGDAYTHAEVAFLPGHHGARNPSEWISAASQYLAEGRHLKRYVSEIDGPLFLDGALYPKAIVSNLLYAKAQSTRIPGAWRDAAEEIVQNYIDGIETQLHAGRPVFAVSKTFRTTELIDSIHEKQDALDSHTRLPWLNDYVYASDLLTRPNPDNRTYTFTSWLKQEAVKIGDTKFKPLADFEFTHFEPADLRRSFFYVRIPSQGVVVRVETPAVVLENLDREERERYQKLVVRELIETRDIPRATEIADDLARIGSRNRERIIEHLHETLRQNGIDTAPVRDYNWDGRWNSLIE